MFASMLVDQEANAFHFSFFFIIGVNYSRLLEEPPASVKPSTKDVLKLLMKVKMDFTAKKIFKMLNYVLIFS